MCTAGILVKRLADQGFGGTCIEQVRSLSDDVRDHDEAHVVTLFLADIRHTLDDIRLDFHDFFRVHDGNLADDDAVLTDLEFLHVILRNLKR